jgi:predicted enzyme related to lactoylglutathione lyase
VDRDGGIRPPEALEERAVNLVSIRLITDDVRRLVDFYEQAIGVTALWSTPDFAEIATSAGTLAIGHTRTVALFGAGSARPADNHTAIIEFLVADVDAEHARLQETVGDLVSDLVAEPTTLPWGNRSLLFRDPDGNLVNFFTPVTPQAIAKFRR